MNEYLAAAEALDFNDRRRHPLVEKYSWAIPDDAALAAIAAYGPIVEIGAGTGYWTMLLRQIGVDIVAYDACPPTTGGDSNRFHKGYPTWTTVLADGPDMAAKHSERTLFLCWPPYKTPMAADCLRAYRGATVIYIGEGYGGCTADDTFHQMLDDEWQCIGADDENYGAIYIPQWRYINDIMRIYRRK